MSLALNQIAALPPLQASAPCAVCKLCGAPCDLFDVVDFLKHCGHGQQYRFGTAGIAVPYFRCHACGFLFATVFDDWPAEAMARHVYNADYVQVDPDYAGSRASAFASRLAPVFHRFKQARVLDYGSGSGVFAQHLRQAGFADVCAYDPFSHPQRPQQTFDLITCFEVIEHSLNPRETFADMRGLLAPGGVIVLSQTVQPVNIEEVRGAWWYLAPRNGHVSLYTAAALQRLSGGGTWRHLERWLWAWTDGVPGEGARFCSAFGTRVAALRLTAPVHDQAHGWHALEGEGEGKFRWMAAPLHTWHVAPMPPGPVTLHLEIPYVLEVHPGFAAGCRLGVNGQQIRCFAGHSALRGESDIEGGSAPIEITLVTPPLHAPNTLGRNGDSRTLGLAVVADGSVSGFD
jgi:2-polyprenyl-6-hydroxyphenyl methylase/3-demethylubiquinone-9 3-methyltransferase